MKCLSCQQDNPSRAKFCIECGTRLPVACPACGAILPERARFCPDCGRRVRPPGGAESPAPEAYTPRHLAEKILISRSALEGERKLVTVLFCDLVGSTALAERLGPDEMHTLLNRFFETALAEIHRYEGTINQFLGDGFMALFGAPLAHEDHARRAALAALSIGRILREQPIALETGEVRPEVRMGLHTGFVIVGAIGDNLRMDYTAVGDTTHLAARLQQLAAPGTILVSDTTTRLAQGYVETEPVGPVRIKGKTEPVVVFRVTGAVQRPSPWRGLEGRTLSRFVGRARELRTLEDLLARAEAGEGQVAGIVGEPGVGKSRLLLEFRRTLAESRVTYVEGRCLSYGSTIPYLPVVDLFRLQCGIVEVDAPAAMVEKVRLGLEEVGMDPEEAGSFLLHLLGLSDTGDRVGRLPGEVVRARTFETLRGFTLGASRRRPLVLAVEDMHWIDRTSEDYLEFLMEGLAGARILLVGTYRSGYRPPWMDPLPATQLSLGRLTVEESLAILRVVLSDPVLAAPEAQAILDKAEGNPFFLEELARAVEEHGGLGSGLRVPDTVHGVLTSRIDRLADQPKRVLQTAAILGREFTPGLLRAIWPGPGAPDHHLRELTRLEFLYERGGTGEPVYVFKHALTQDVAVAMLLAPVRRDLHRRAAEALEVLQPGRLGELAPVLAHHYYEAEAWGPAAEWARQAARAASAVYANREARSHYDRGITAAARAGLPPAARLELHEGRGSVYSVLGEFEPARADLEAALALAEVVGDGAARARVLGALGLLWGGHKDYQRGLELTQEAAELIAASGDARELAEARLRLGLMRLNLAQMAAAGSQLESALRLFEAGADEPGQARTLDVLAMVMAISGDLDLAVRYYEEAIPQLRRLGDRQTEASCTVNLGFALGYRGRWRAAEPWIRQALDVARAIGARAGEAYVHSITGEVAEPYGAYGLALREASLGLDLARRVGHREWMALSLAVMGGVFRRCGDPARARHLHEEMLTLAREAGSTLWIAAALGEIGQDLAHLGEEERGVSLLAESVAASGEALKFALRPMVAAADLALRRGDPAEALERARRLQEAAPQFEVFVADARRIEGEALAALGRLEEAETVLRGAKAQATVLGAALPQWLASLGLAGVLRRVGRVAEGGVATAEAVVLIERVAADLPDAALGECFRSSEPVRRARAALS